MTQLCWQSVEITGLGNTRDLGISIAILWGAMSKPSVPDRFGKYNLVSFIGRGGMGEVWLAVRRDLGMPCVVKIMRPELSADPEYRAMFLNEARIASQLRNNRIVRVHDLGETRPLPGNTREPGEPRGLLYLIMDRIDGVNLAQFMAARAGQAGRLGVALVAYIIGELLEALSYAHGRTMGGVHDMGVIHHDITPSNILVSSRGEIMLTDFGIARFAGTAMLESRPVGTLKYMAPEQLLGRVSRQSDLYAVGGVLHELLTGHPPLPSGADTERLRSALLLDPTPGTGRDDVPEPLERLRRALLEKTPARRIRSADDGLAILAGLPNGRSGGPELRALYARLIGPSSTGLTQYLQAQSASQRPSFLAPLLEHWRVAEDDSEEVMTRRWGGALPTVGGAPPAVSGVEVLERTMLLKSVVAAVPTGEGEGEGEGEADAPERTQRHPRSNRATERPGQVLAPFLHREAILQRAAVLVVDEPGNAIL
jgi:serine/threonine protein kinase